MGKKHYYTDEQRLQEVRQEYFNLTSKYYKRDATTNEAHKQYVWNLISEFTDQNLRMSWFLKLRSTCEKLHIGEKNSCI